MPFAAHLTSIMIAKYDQHLLQKGFLVAWVVGNRDARAASLDALGKRNIIVS